MDSIIKHIDHDYNSIKNIIKTLTADNEFLASYSIGKSVLGKDIPAIKIGKSDEYILYVAAFHGSERITAIIILKFLEELCCAVKNKGNISGIDARGILKARGAIFVPMINPDGCEIAAKGSAAGGAFSSKISRLCGGNYKKWNANARGVDINHNFNAGWELLHKRERECGIYGPSSTRFGGLKPESEPETLALTELCHSVKIRHALAFHSQGEVIYWDYNNKSIPRAKKMAEIMATSSGYALDVPIGLAMGGGFKDWFIEELGRPGFTIEVGLGENPLPPESVGDLYDKLREMMTLCLLM
ncbi:MAG: M14 family metallocarboxypeptidase [Oscillospiraceae bacterium]